MDSLIGKWNPKREQSPFKSFLCQKIFSFVLKKKCFLKTKDLGKKTWLK